MKLSTATGRATCSCRNRRDLPYTSSQALQAGQRWRGVQDGKLPSWRRRGGGPTLPRLRAAAAPAQPAACAAAPPAGGAGCRGPALPARPRRGLPGQSAARPVPRVSTSRGLAPARCRLTGAAQSRLQHSATPACAVPIGTDAAAGACAACRPARAASSTSRHAPSAHAPTGLQQWKRCHAALRPWPAAHHLQRSACCVWAQRRPGQHQLRLGPPRRAAAGLQDGLHGLRLLLQALRRCSQPHTCTCSCIEQQQQLGCWRRSSTSASRPASTRSGWQSSLSCVHASVTGMDMHAWPTSKQASASSTTTALSSSHNWLLLVSAHTWPCQAQH